MVFITIFRTLIFFNILHFYSSIKSAKNFLALEVFSLCVCKLGLGFWVKISSRVRIRVNVRDRVKTVRVKTSRVKKSPTHIKYCFISAPRVRASFLRRPVFTITGTPKQVWIPPIGNGVVFTAICFYHYWNS